MTNHPITPPPELVQQWLGTYFGTTVTGEVSEVELALATQAARWGADQELEACEMYLAQSPYPSWAKDFRAARRPKPPSLKEQALKALHTSVDLDEFPKQYDTIRKALEQLNDE